MENADLMKSIVLEIERALPSLQVTVFKTFFSEAEENVKKLSVAEEKIKVFQKDLKIKTEKLEALQALKLNVDQINKDRAVLDKKIFEFDCHVEAQNEKLTAEIQKSVLAERFFSIAMRNTDIVRQKLADMPVKLVQKYADGNEYTSIQHETSEVTETERKE